MESNKYIERTLSPEILKVQAYYPVTLLTGARQVGKTTLCRHLFPDYSFVNLEDFATFNFAQTDPTGFLDSLGNRAIIDEIQNCPMLFSTLQARVDANQSLRYILTGSSNFPLMRNSSQSLAGRVALFTLPPFTFAELGKPMIDIPTDQLMYRGFYPSPIIKGIPQDIFYRNYYNTYIQRDVRDLLKVGNLGKFDTFMRLLAGRTASEFNASAIAVEVGVSSPTISEWFSILEASHLVFPLRPYYANISKRLTKMPKIYFFDTGLICYLLGIEEPQQIATHPLRGAIFENMAISELMKARINQAKDPNLNFYRENSGKEVDAVETFPGGIKLFEVKSGKTFRAEYIVNMKYAATILPSTIISSQLVYDGPTMSREIINIRDILL